MKQPLPALPAFSVLAEVFSYWGVDEDVIDLLHLLSRKTRKYVKSSHRAMLVNACIRVQRTKVPATSPSTSKTKCQPFSMLVRGDKACGLRLSEIRVSMDPVISMSSLQIVMSDDATEEERHSAVVGTRVGQ